VDTLALSPYQVELRLLPALVLAGVQGSVVARERLPAAVQIIRHQVDKVQQPAIWLPWLQEIIRETPIDTVS
jgi:hypothetical protein